MHPVHPFIKMVKNLKIFPLTNESILIHQIKSIFRQTLRIVSSGMQNEIFQTTKLCIIARRKQKLLCKLLSPIYDKQTYPSNSFYQEAIYIQFYKNIDNSQEYPYKNHLYYRMVSVRRIRLYYDMFCRRYQDDSLVCMNIGMFQVCWYRSDYNRHLMLNIR